MIYKKVLIKSTLHQESLNPPPLLSAEKAKLLVDIGFPPIRLLLECIDPKCWSQSIKASVSTGSPVLSLHTTHPPTLSGFQLH
jgi:hypothetical protein